MGKSKENWLNLYGEVICFGEIQKLKEIETEKKLKEKQKEKTKEEPIKEKK